MHTTADYIAIVMLFLLLALSCYFLSTEQAIQSKSIGVVIETRVSQEFRERYRSVPVVHGKYVTVLGKEMIVEE